MAQRVYISVSNDIITDQRVLKVAELLMAEGYEVTVVGRLLRYSLHGKNSPCHIRRFKMLFKSGFFFYKWLNIRLFFYLLFKKADLLIANDLDTLMPNFLVSRIKNVPLIYDAHEYYTGTPELQGRKFVWWVWKMIERYTIPKLKYMITVNDSIAALYHKEYGIDPVVVRNISKKPEPGKEDKQELGIDENDLLLIIQGTGINIDRGGIEAIKAVEAINKSKDIIGGKRNAGSVHLLVIGRGDAVPYMKEYVLENKLIDIVTFLAPMQWDDMMRYTKMADIGLSLDRPDSLNYRLSLPNKIFDYLNSGIAIIATNLQEIDNVIKDFDCGVLINYLTVESLTDAIINLNDNRDLLNSLKNNSIRASQNYDWEDEKMKILYIINAVGSTKPLLK